MAYTIDYNVIDDSQVKASERRVVAMFGTASKGPLRTTVLLSSEQGMLEAIGPEIAGFDAIHNVRQAIQAGCRVRFSRVVHLTDVTDFSTRTSIAADLTLQDTDGTPEDTITITAYEEGTWANGVAVTVAAATNGDATAFNLTIAALPSLNIPAQSWENITVADITVPGLVTSKYWVLSDENSASVPPLDRPADGSFVMGTTTSGNDGTGSIAAGDYLAAAGTGLQALIGQTDFIDTFAPDLEDNAQHLLWVTECEVQGWMAHISLASALTQAVALDYRRQTGTYVAGTAIDSANACMHFGDVEYRDYSDPAGGTALFKNHGAMAGVIAFNDRKQTNSVTGQGQLNPPGPHLAPSGPKRGRTNATSVHNLLTKAQRTALIGNGVNVFEYFNGAVQSKGNRTLQTADTLLRWLNVKRMLLQLQQDLRPVLEGFQDEPNDLVLWSQAYNAIKPFLDKLKDDRAVHDYYLNTDHLVKDPADAVLNTPSIIDAGQFKVLIRLKPITTVEDITINVVVDNSSVDYKVL